MYRPLLVITGIRRIGKTSVMNVALNESKIPFAVIDCRKLKENYSRADLYRVFSEALSSIVDKIKIHSIHKVSFTFTITTNNFASSFAYIAYHKELKSCYLLAFSLFEF